MARSRQNGLRQGDTIFMGFKVPAIREEIGDSLDKYSVNCDISPSGLLFIKGE